MLENRRKHTLFLAVFLLLIADFFLFYSDWQDSHRGFTFAMLNVGQGDALFIESPTGSKLLVDGGPKKKILGELPLVMSPFDRNLDAILITNPDQDHIAGFLDVLSNYKVGSLLEPGTLTDSKTYSSLKDEITNKNIPDILLRKGMKIDMGGGTFIDILFPDRDVSSWATNDGSTVARLSYGKTSVMLTGDASIKTEKIILAENNGNNLRSSILKVGHHGSRSSSSPLFVRAVSPSLALISDGKDNKYGHPHKEVLDLLRSSGADILRTDLSGTIILKCARIGSCEINKLKN